MGFTTHNIYRVARSAATSVHQCGGGVLIMVHGRFNSYVISSENEYAEQLFVHLLSHHLDIIIVVVYFPPKSPLNSYSQFIYCLEHVFEKNPNSKFVVFGDFNLPHTLWVNEDDCIECNFLNA